tara:strand:- start:3904 stop:4179 length:276 start_codon:yes stop_codon:yes gene_type:complete
MNPKLPSNIHKDSQFIYGIGASSWFYIKPEKKNYRIERYSEEGELECSLIFSVKNQGFDINKPFQFTYISNCKECTIKQENIEYKFEVIKN